MDDLSQPPTTAEVHTEEATVPEINEPSSKRQKIIHNPTPDQRDHRPGIAPIKPE
jgi:hypothetical protein